MRNGFITIWLIATIISVVSCAATLKPSSERKQPLRTAAVNTCNKQNITVDDDYAWLIPRYHNTITNQPASFGITQTRTETNQFIICSECSCPTHKSSTKTNVKSNPKKVVINFDHASYRLSERQQQALTRLYQSLPERSQLTIIGYTDDTAAGGRVTNESLAQNRAKAVLDFLVALGFEEHHATLKASPLCCYVAPNTNKSGRALNRRVEIVMTSLSTNR